MNLPPVTPRYFEVEFEGAFESGSWDGKVWLAWNKYLNDLALQGEAILAKEEQL